MRNIFSLFIFISFASVFVSSSGGRAFSGGEGNTGAPGDNSKTCSTCHTGGQFDLSGEIQLSDMLGNTVDKYIPGETYEVRLNLSANTDAKGFGFQMVSLIDNNELDSEGLAAQSDNVQLVTLNERNYAEHKGGASSEAFFVMNWTAPVQNSGSVSFYSAFNAVNLADGTSGDQAGSTTLTIEEMLTSVNSNSTFNISIYPNPFQDRLTIDNIPLAAKSYVLFDVMGKEALSGSIHQSDILIDIDALDAGVYSFILLDGEKNIMAIERIVKH